MSLAAGEPDFPTPKPIREACIRALEAGHTGYAPSAGVPELRLAVRERYRAELDLDYGDDQVVVSCGAKQCLYNAMQSLLDPGDGAVIQAPYWVSYPAQVVLAGGETVILPMGDKGFGLNREALASLEPGRAKLIVINSPSNPTGHVLDEADLDAVAEVARRHDLVILSDDIYDQITYDDRRPLHILERHPDLRDRTLIINGVSKTYSMTGWRLGYALGPAPLIAAMRKVQDQSTSNATTFVQYAAVAALASPPELTAGMLSAFAERRLVMIRKLRKLPGVSCAMPAGSFYAFPSFAGALGKHIGQDEVASTLQLSELLLEHERVAVVPGEAFGAPGFLRFSFACSLATIEEAVERVGRVLARLE